MRSADYAMARCLSVRLYVWLSHAGIVCKRLYISSKSFHHRVAPPWSVEWRHLNFQWPSTSLNQISRARHYSCTCVLTIKLISFCRPILYDMRVVGILESWNRWRLTDLHSRLLPEDCSESVNSFKNAWRPLMSYSLQAWTTEADQPTSTSK